MNSNFGSIVLTQLGSFVPELVLTVLILLLIVADLVAKGRGRVTHWLSLAGLAVTFITVLPQLSAERILIFAESYSVDSIAAFFKLIFLAGTAVIVVLSWNQKRFRGEYNTLLVISTLGMVLLSGARDFIIVVIGLEMLSLMSYALAGLNRESRFSTEAALKYLLFGALSSGFMLYGISLLYGVTGTTNIVLMAKTLAASHTYPLTLMVGGLMIIMGIGYKISMVPFHFWTPDVYEGSLTPITTFFSVGPKVAGLVALARIMFGDFTSANFTTLIPVGNVDMPFVIALLSAFTMTLGNLSAINQKNLKRLLAYSGIAHAGYLMMGLVVFSMVGLKAIMFYAVVYLFMNYGAFLIVDGVEKRTGSADIENFRGLGSLAPYAAFAMTVFLVSLVGLPPMAGFIGKYYLFFAVLEKKIYWLVVVAVLNSVVSLYYYFSIVYQMYLKDPDSDASLRLSSLHLGLMTVMLVPILLFGVYWGPLADWISASASHLF